jgi:hypothetical protein
VIAFPMTKIRRNFLVSHSTLVVGASASASASAATKAKIHLTDRIRMGRGERVVSIKDVPQDDRLGTATPPTLDFRRWPIGKCVLVDFNLPATPLTNSKTER